MRIIYPKPIKKARKYRIVEIGTDLQILFLFIAGFVVFLMLMQSLPYIMRLAGWL